MKALLICASLTAVDGDTVKCDGVNLRPMGDGAPYVSGFDAPEIRGEKCPQEERLGLAAKARMTGYLRAGVQIEDSGVEDRYGRPLVVLRLSDGSTVGRRMIEDGLAKTWEPGARIDWCS
ncbi:thermonuclease family protein [Algicella marina]|uniref:Thermonuclease family protein n=1 Tax=Algicella marina TaxID=2683284 RepID=A0A6P1SZK2_9RHOB|nr:thermonuclease family protein [Algicella marina]QHQ34881.1 thermonuclease family protein [Algicella marina]